MRRLFFHFFISELRSRRRLCKGFFIPCNFQRSIEAVSDPQSSGVDRGSIYSSLCVCFLRTDKQQHVQSPGLLETRQLFNWWTPGPGSVSVLRELRSTTLFWRVLQNPQIVILNSHAVDQLQAKRTGRQRRKGRAVDDIFIREQSAQRNLPILLSRSDRWSVLPMELGRTQYIFSHWEETLYSQRGGV